MYIRVVAVSFLLLLLVPLQAYAQLSFGIYLDQEQTSNIRADHLETFGSNHVELLVSEGFIGAQMVDNRFRVMASVPEYFTISQTSPLSFGPHARNLLHYHQHYRDFEHYDGIIAGSHPDLNDSEVRHFYESAASEFNRELQAGDQPELFLITNMDPQLSVSYSFIRDARATYPAPAVFSNMLILPSFRGANAIRNLRDKLGEASRDGFETLLFRHADFEYLLERSDLFNEILSAYSEQVSPVAPVPALEPESPPIRADVILILLLWLSFSIHFRFNPNYNRTILRFFVNYSFLTEDILKRHIIMGGSIVVMFVQIIFLWAMVASTALSSLLGPVGMQALSHYYAFVPGEWSLFFLALAMGTVFNIFILLWLIGTCFRLGVFSQAATFLFWPMHLGFPLATILVLISVVFPGSPLIAALALLFFLLNIFSFYQAAYAFGKEPTFGPLIHFISTSGLYTVFLVVAALGLFWYTDLFNVLLLGFRLN